MEQGSNPTKAGGMSSVLRSFCLVLFVLFVVFLLYHVTSTIQRPAPPNRVKTAIIEDEEVGLEEIPDEQEADDGVELSEEITFLFAIINMNRTAHLGIDHYTFEKDYLQQMKNILKLYKKEKVQIIIQQRYYDHLKDLVTNNVNVRFVEIEDLLNWKYTASIELIRNSPWWVPATPWLANVPQGYSPLYNPIVMHKLLWLRDLSILNPFRTRYFVWLDSGGICTPRISPNYGMNVANFKQKVRYKSPTTLLRDARLVEVTNVGRSLNTRHYLDKFFMAVTPYAMSHELHGCYREAMHKLTHDQPPCFITKGWTMGGQKSYLVKVANLYEYILNKTLDLGCLGTEETLLTMAYYRRPDLFHVHHNLEDRSNPFGHGGDVCHMVWPGQEPQGVPVTPAEKYHLKA